MSDNDLRLITLGRFALEATGAEAIALNRQRRKLAVLTVVALSKRPFTRDALIGMFWAEQDETRARHSLVEALSHIRRAVGRDTIATRVAEVALAATSRLQVDALEFAEAATAGDHARAVALYEGPFLDRVYLDDAPAFVDWADRERMRLEGLFKRAAENECLRLARARHWDACGAVALRWLDTDSLSADAALYRLNALKASGDRAGLQRAVAEYELLVRRLQTEYELAPDASVTSLATELAERLSAMPAPIASMETEATVAASERATSPPLVAPPFAPAQPPADAERVHPASASVARRRRATLGAAIATLATIAAALLLVWRGGEKSPAAATSTPIAVALIPFTYIGADSANVYLAEGLTEEVSAALGGVKGIRVIVGSQGEGGSRATSGAPANVGAAHLATLGADAVIYGSVRTGAGRLRVTVRLSSARGSNQLWAQTYEAESTDALTMERDIATSVVEALRKEVGAAVGTLAKRRPVDPRTFELYLRGRYFENRSGETALQRAEQYYTQALAQDSTFAPAWAGLAAVSLTKFHWGHSYGEAIPLAREYAERALRLAPELSAAHTVSAGLLRADWRWEDAVGELQRALALNPSDADARHSLSHLYFALARPDDALREARNALALDPLNPRIGMHLCVALEFARRHDEALAACLRGMELDSTFPDSHSKLAWVLMRLGRNDEARRELDREMSASGRTPQYVLQRALVEAHAGNLAVARMIADSVQRSTLPIRLPLTMLALVHAQLNDGQRVFELVESAVTARAVEIEEEVHAPEFDAFANDPRFRRVLSRLGLRVR